VAERPDPDEPLVAELRDLFMHDDPVPPPVTELAKASLGWRRLDADLAELLSDSLLEEGAPAGARGSGDGLPVRSVRFRASTTTVDLDVQVNGSKRTLLGQITPPLSAKIEIQSTTEVIGSVVSDELGRFRVNLPAGGLIRLAIEDSPALPAPIVSSWITI
jgi:hypothetical protein